MCNVNSVQFSGSVMSNSLQPHGLQYTRLPCPSPTPTVCSKSCPLSRLSPLLSPSPPAFNLSHHQGLFKWVSSSQQVAKVLELQLQHQYFQWTFRVDFIQDWLVWFLVYFRGPRDKCFSLGSPKPTISATLLFQKNQKYVITNEIFIIL